MFGIADEEGDFEVAKRWMGDGGVRRRIQEVKEVGGREDEEGHGQEFEVRNGEWRWGCVDDPLLILLLAPQKLMKPLCVELSREVVLAEP